MMIGGHLLRHNSSGACYIEPGFIRVEEQQIVALETGEIPRSVDLGGADCLVMPGMIDAHVHLPQFDMIGAHGMPLLRWLNDVTFPQELRWANLDHAQAMTSRVIDQLIGCGTTGICAYATVHHESALAALRIASQRGMRGVIGQVLMDRNAPSELCYEAPRLLEETAVLLASFPRSARMAAAVTPRFAIACSETLLSGAGQLAAETGAIVQTHLAETQAECQWVEELFDGRRYVDVYADAGLLRQTSICGHGIHLDDHDRAKLRATGSIIAHCPTANSFLRSGTMQRTRLLADGVSLVIGSDIGAGYERSMVRVARAMIEAASSIGDVFPSAAAAWYAITAGNADTLGWGDVGRLQIGATADIVVAYPDLPWLDRGVDPLSMLMFAWDDRWIRHVLLRGQVGFSLRFD